jgi:pyruvate dehydrogenase E2 component (dihydrolipoamide acetyltransferase)
VNVNVPDLGEFSDVEVIEILVEPGDVVAVDDSLITLETDKATMEVPSPAAGTVREVKVSAGSKVSTGDLIVVLEDAAAEDAGEESAASSAGTETAADGGQAAAASASGEQRPVEDLTVRQPRPARAAGGEAAPTSVTVPDLGDFSDVEVIDVLVAPGDELEAEQGLITLETEKATMDVPTPVAGTLLELKVAVGDKLNAGDEIARVRTSGTPDGAAAASGSTAAAAERAPGPAAAAAETRSERPAAPPLPAATMVDEQAFSRAHASPSVRKLARELGVDLGRVPGSGRKGRVTDDDVKAFVKQIMRGGGAPGAALPQVPDVDFARFGPVETQKLTRIQKISGPRLHASWVNIPHVTQHDEADITELEKTRQSLKDQAAERGIKLTPLAFVMRAVSLTLAEYPLFRASLSRDGQSLVLKHYMHIGFAADTPNGLVVPVIRDVDKKDIYELASALVDLSGKARDGKLKGDEMQGGVFTISSLGGIGGSFFTPIINAPEVAILGVSRNAWKPVLQDGEFVPRLLLPLSLSYDHRVIDGAEAARFITRLSETLGQVDRLIEAIP